MNTFAKVECKISKETSKERRPLKHELDLNRRSGGKEQRAEKSSCHRDMK